MAKYNDVFDKAKGFYQSQLTLLYDSQGSQDWCDQLADMAEHFKTPLEKDLYIAVWNALSREWQKLYG